MTDIGGLPPTALVLGGAYVIATTGDYRIWIGIAMIVVGIYLQKNYISRMYPNKIKTEQKASNVTAKKFTDNDYLKYIAKSLTYAEAVGTINMVLFVFLTGSIIGYTYLQSQSSPANFNLVYAAVFGAVLAFLVIITRFLLLPQALFPKRRR